MKRYTNEELNEMEEQYKNDSELLKYVHTLRQNYYIEDAMEQRKNQKDWYVLKYDIKTTEYNNEIIFQTFDKACTKYLKTYSSYPEERIELIFAPEEEDEDFSENAVVISKIQILTDPCIKYCIEIRDTNEEYDKENFPGTIMRSIDFTSKQAAINYGKEIGDKFSKLFTSIKKATQEISDTYMIDGKNNCQWGTEHFGLFEDIKYSQKRYSVVLCQVVSYKDYEEDGREYKNKQIDIQELYKEE